MLALGLGLTAALIWAVHDLLARKLSQGAALLPIVLVVLGAGTLATWLIVAVFFRISSFAALVAAVFAPCFAFMLFGAHPVTWATIPMGLLLVLRHRPNIERLLAGTEPRIGAQKKPAAEPNP